MALKTLFPLFDKINSQKLAKLNQLFNIAYPNDEEWEERERLKEELGLSYQESNLKPLGTELELLREERKALELQLRVKREKDRIEKLKNKLDGKVWCDDHKEWVYPEHFK